MAQKIATRKQAEEEANRHEEWVAGVTKDGRNVYHCLDGKNPDCVRQFIFTLDPDAVDGEERFDCSGQFDARDMPEAFWDSEKSPIDCVIQALDGGWDPSAE